MFGYDTEIAERLTTNYYLPQGVVASLVEAGEIVYLEIEKISAKKEVVKNSELLLDILNELEIELHLIKTKHDFDKLCGLLSQKTDWKFTGAVSQYKKLEKLLLLRNSSPPKAHHQTHTNGQSAAKTPQTHIYTT